MTTRTSRHPLAQQTYVLLDDGTVEITDERSGKTGTFRATGEWLSGELRSADPHMLTWITRPDLPQFDAM